MSVNSTSSTDPNLVNQNRVNNQNDTVETDDGVETTTAAETVETVVNDPVNQEVDINLTNELGTETDVTGTDTVDDTDPTNDVVGISNMAAEGYDSDLDGELSFELTNAIKGGADIQDTFKSELMSIADEKFGPSEIINEILDNNGNKIQQYRAEDGSTYKIIEYDHDEKYDMNKAAIMFDDNSMIELQILDNAIGGVGVHRISGEKDDGSRDFTYVNSTVIQEGTSQANENGEWTNNYDQVNRADGSIIEDATTTFHENGMITTEYDDDEGIGHLIVGNSNHTASKHYTSEDNYSTSIDDSYAMLGEDGFVNDWDDGANIDTADALYKNFDEELDPFLAELLAEIMDPSAVGEVDGVDGTEVTDEEADDGELNTEASSVDDLTLDTNGDGVVSDEERAGNNATTETNQTTTETTDTEVTAGDEDIENRTTTETETSDE